MLRLNRHKVLPSLDIVSFASRNKSCCTLNDGHTKQKLKISDGHVMLNHDEVKSKEMMK